MYDQKHELCLHKPTKLYKELVLIEIKVLLLKH